MIGDPPDNPIKKDSRTEAMKEAQIVGGGISADYIGVEFSALILQCRMLIGRPELEPDVPVPPRELRELILKKAGTIRSYAEYINGQNEATRRLLEESLTKEGEVIVAKLNEIVLEIKKLIQEKPNSFNVAVILALLERGKYLVVGREKRRIEFLGQRSQEEIILKSEK